MTLIITPIYGLPIFSKGDNLTAYLLQAIKDNNIDLLNGDILVIAQKIISKVEGRLINLSEVVPSDKAVEIAHIVEKDPRFVECVLGESKKIIRCRPGILIVEHNLGFICANAGIDHSNVKGPYGQNEDWVLLLPKNPDRSAENIRNEMEEKTNVKLGVLIIDSHGRAWRMGIVGTTIGVSGIPGLVDKRGEVDLFGYKLKVTQIAAADELAAAASLMMGQAAEGVPAVHVRGFPYPLRNSYLSELIRPENQDLFR